MGREKMGKLPLFTEREPRNVIISTTDPRYQEERMVTADVTRRRLQPFGYQLFTDFQDNQASVLPFYSDRLLNVHSHELGQQEIRAFFQEGLQDRKICSSDEIQSLTKNMPGGNRAIGDIVDAFLQHNISAAVMVDFFRAHQERCIKEQQRFQTELPELKGEYFNRMYALIRDSQHPLTQSMMPDELALKRLEEVALLAIDPLLMLINQSVIGEYDHEQNYAGILFDRSFHGNSAIRAYRPVLWHELWHVLSGRQIMQSRNQMKASRIGLLNRENSRYSWLNEAITETLTGDLIGKGRHWEHGFYRSERNIYKRLLQKIPEELFLLAYFENSEPNQPDVHQQQLFSEIDRVYGTGFLGKLDDMVIANDPLKVSQQFDISGNWVGN